MSWPTLISKRLNGWQTVKVKHYCLKFKAAGTKLALELLRDKETEDATNTLFNMPRDLDDEVLKFEHDLISQALAKVEGGQVVDAANG